MPLPGRTGRCQEPTHRPALVRPHLPGHRMLQDTRAHAGKVDRAPVFLQSRSGLLVLLGVTGPTSARLGHAPSPRLLPGPAPRSSNPCRPRPGSWSRPGWFPRPQRPYHSPNSALSLVLHMHKPVGQWRHCPGCGRSRAEGQQARGAPAHRAGSPGRGL